MTSLSIKRVYEAASDHDGTRSLVDRLWPRGVSKGAAALDYWAKDVAPTDELRKWFDHRPERFAEFKRRYLGELQNNPAVAQLRGHIAKSRTTLLYGAKDPDCNQAVVLAEFLRKTR
jgi:uncharacterized protein YeaO (DUF488 family)